MSEELVVRQCAPTLAGIKTGSLFSCPCDSPEELRQEVRRINRLLAGKGLCLLPLRFDGSRALLYLYRPSRLRQDLEDAEAVRLLEESGYPCHSAGQCVACLIRRLRENDEFPHEIGLFSAIPRRMYGASSRTRPAASSVPDCGRSMATRSGPRSCSVSISAAPTGAAPCGGRAPDWHSWPCDIFFNRERNETIMKKTAVVYWSSTGNTEAMAQAVLEGMKEAGAEAVLLTPDAVDVGALAGMDAIAFGCPAMGSEVLEECEFEPMFSGCKNRLGGKSVGLFGSYGWGDGQWMRDWEKDCDDAGINLVCESVICCETPDDAALEACRAMGKVLAE